MYIYIYIHTFIYTYARQVYGVPPRGPYANNLRCRWTISSSNIGSQITLIFSAFATESSYDVVCLRFHCNFHLVDFHFHFHFHLLPSPAFSFSACVCYKSWALQKANKYVCVCYKSGLPLHAIDGYTLGCACVHVCVCMDVLVCLCIWRCVWNLCIREARFRAIGSGLGFGRKIQMCLCCVLGIVCATYVSGCACVTCVSGFAYFCVWLVFCVGVCLVYVWYCVCCVWLCLCVCGIRVLVSVCVV